MLIGIDASRYIAKQKTGVERYSFEIINGLTKIAKQQKEHTLILYTPKHFGKYPTKHEDYDTQVFICAIPFKRLWTQVRLSWEMILRTPDILFVPSHVLPVFHPQKAVVMIHDVAFKYFRKAYSLRQYLYLNWSTKLAAREASKLIVPSEATKKDLIKFYNCPPEKITVIPHGVTPLPVLKKSNEALLAKFGLKKDDQYLLFIGRLEAKKNLVRVVSAFKEFNQKFPEFKLILAGNRGVGFKEILKKVEALGLEKKVLMPGYIDKYEKDVLLRKAAVFVFPSLYEGFGLPVLEAFSYQVPVLTSNCSSLPEVAGEGALPVDPKSVSEIAAGMAKLTQDKDLREKLVEKGTAQLKKFNWERAAEETWEVLVS